MRQEVFKYLIAGGLAFFTDLSVLYSLTELLGVHYLLSNIISYSCGLVVAYVLNTRWVFSYRRYAQKTKREFLIFTAIALVGLVINEIVLLAMVGEGSVYFVYAKFVATFFVMVFNFIAKKRLLFQPQ